MCADSEKGRLRAEAKARRQAAFERHGRGAAEDIAAQGLAFIDAPAGRIVSGFSFPENARLLSGDLRIM